MTEPIALSQAKEHLRVQHENHDHDYYIARLIPVVRAYAENYQHRKMITQTITKYFQQWVGADENIFFGDGFYLPYGQLQSVTSIKYTDTAGDQSTWAASNYDVDSDSDPGVVRLAYGKTFPSTTLTPTNPIEIIYVCGYGTAGSDVPDETVHAMLIMLADLFENRESYIIGQSVTAIMSYGTTKIVENLLNLNKLWKF